MAAGQDRRRPRRPADRASNTRSRLPLAAASHLLPFFGEHRLDEIDPDCAWSSRPTSSSEAARAARGDRGGADLRDDATGGASAARPATIRKLIACCRDPRRGGRGRPPRAQSGARQADARQVPKPPRTFLEMDELVALIDAAAEQDPRSARRALPGAGRHRARVAELLSAGMRARRNRRRRSGRPQATVTYHCPAFGATARPLRRRGASSGPAAQRRAGQRAMRHAHPATCGCTPRAEPASASPTRRPRPASARCRSAPTSLDEFVAHLDRLRRAGQPTDLEDYLSRTARRPHQPPAGREIIREAACSRPSSAARGLPPLPNTTPAHAAPHVHLDRAARQQVRREVGHGPGRPRRLEDDDGRLRAAAAAPQARARRGFDAMIREAEELMHGEGIDDARWRRRPRRQATTTRRSDERDGVDQGDAPDRRARH